MLKIIPVHALQPGMVIVKVTKQNGPVPIKKSGLVSSQMMITGLAEMGIQEVEVDLAQTVEIASEEAPVASQKSKTQALLTSESRRPQEQAVSEQFNRSLFLPSLGDIPSLWQYHAKRWATVLFLSIGGFALGLSLYKLQVILAHATQAELVQVVSSQPTEESERVPQEPIVKPASTVETKPEPTTRPQSDAIEQVQTEEPVSQKPESAPASSEIRQADTARFEPESEPEPRISPELLKRFESVIRTLDEEPTQEYKSPPTSVDNVPRVDQLPAWVMTQLPSMSFSAHMYASEKQDRWLRVNGQRMLEGDMIDNKIKIIAIEPQHVILHYAGQEFSMQALTDW